MIKSTPWHAIVVAATGDNETNIMTCVLAKSVIENHGGGKKGKTIALVGRDDDQKKESQLARNAIVLMTLHSAKGLEFPVVFVLAVEQNLLPHERALESGELKELEEERRLLYVACTRARKDLTLFVPRMLM